MNQHPTNIEIMLHDIVCRVAGIPSLEHDQNYFDAGLASGQALELLLELEEKLEVNIPDDQYINIRTLKELSQLITSQGVNA